MSAFILQTISSLHPITSTANSYSTTHQTFLLHFHDNMCYGIVYICQCYDYQETLVIEQCRNFNNRFCTACKVKQFV